MIDEGENRTTRINFNSFKAATPAHRPKGDKQETEVGQTRVKLNQISVTSLSSPFVLSVERRGCRLWSPRHPSAPPGSPFVSAMSQSLDASPRT